MLCTRPRRDGPQEGLRCAVRSRLWLRGDWLGQRNEESLLWVHLDDARVLAFRLPTDAFEDDDAVGELQPPPLVGLAAQR